MKIDVDALLLERQLEYEEESRLAEIAIEEERAQHNASLKRKAGDIEEMSPESISTRVPLQTKGEATETQGQERSPSMAYLYPPQHPPLLAVRHTRQ